MSEGFIGRWSRKKREAAAPEQDRPAAPAVVPPVANAAAGEAAPAVAPVTLADPQALPPLESLTPHSDFSAFLRPGVEPGTRAQALKTLFGDPALYPMDGLDVYIDDYSKPDPLPEGWLEKLNQYAALDSVPAAEEAARKAEAQEALDKAAAAEQPAGGPASETVAALPEAAPGTPEPECASDPLPPADVPVEPIHRDAI
ncbi:MAG TPA: DUF3306 domain-containing protein [Usitatibacter sp.]|jgi:hypothetical protein|nr:DUF3306 domain-containing protein [Usitatibacter sp.]